MADIQIPQRTPPQPQFQGAPADLIQALYNRPKPGEIAANSLNQGVANLLDQYYKRQQLKAQAFGEGGPYLMNMLYGNGQQPSAAPSQPQSGGAVPSNASSSPQSPAQTLQGQPAQEQGQQGGVPETIQASLNMGHPDLTGLYSQAQQYQGMGKYGRTQIENLGNMATLATAPITAQQKALEMQKTRGDIAMQPTEFAAKQQALENARQQIPMEIKKTVAGEVSKQSQDTQNITQLKTLAGSLATALQGHNSGILGNLSGDAYQATGGRYGSASAAAIQNAANPLATALNTELARRFNSGEVALLSQSLIPQPKDTPEYAQQKLANLNRLLDSMASGNEKNVRNVAAAISSGSIPQIGGTQGQVQHSAAPQGRITVRSPNGQIGHIPATKLQAALSQGYTQQ